MAWTKIAPQFAGIVALSVIFVTGTRSEPVSNPPRMSFPEIARQLRVGMSMDEALAMIFGAGARRPGLSGSPYSWRYRFVDEKGEYELRARSQEKGHILEGQSDSRLVEWDLRRR